MSEKDDFDSRPIELAIKAIRKHAKGKRGVVGSIACPTCGKSLLYSIAAYNGHIHAVCKTSNCVHFME